MYDNTLINEYHDITKILMNLFVSCVAWSTRLTSDIRLMPRSLDQYGKLRDRFSIANSL